MNKVIEIILAYLLFFSLIFLSNYIFKFEHHWGADIGYTILFTFMMYIHFNKKAQKVFLDAMNKSRKRQESKK